MDIICSRCNGASPEGSVFCSNCGTPLRVARNYAASWPQTGAVAVASQATEPVAPTRPPAAPRTVAARPRRWFRRKAIVVPLVLLAILLTGMAGGAWYINSRFGVLNELSTPPPEISGDRLGGDEGLTIDTDAAQQSVEDTDDNNPALADSPEGSAAILLMGVDARPGEPIDVDVRADSLSVVFLDGQNQTCRMLSIPRDTRVELPGYGYTKINHALSIGGVPYQQLVVENLLGMDIDHYGLIDFAGMAQLVDAVGGVTVVNDEEFYEHPFSYPVGTLELNGEEALNFARYRGGADGDFGRQERQQQVVRALLEKGASLDIVTAVPDLLSAVEGHVRTDLGPTGLIDLGQDFRSGCTSETLETSRLDGTISNEYDDVMQMELSFVVVPDSELQAKSAWLRG